MDAANRHIRDGGRGAAPRIGEKSYNAALDDEMIASMLPPKKFDAFKAKRSGTSKPTESRKKSKSEKAKKAPKEEAELERKGRKGDKKPKDVS